MSHDPSEIIPICCLGSIILFLSDVENSCAASYFCGNPDTFVQVSLMNREFCTCCMSLTLRLVNVAPS